MQKSRRKNYFVRYDKHFANTYNLRWCYEEDEPIKDKLYNAGYIRIRQSRAQELVAQEVYRQKNDPSKSGYADDVIYPWNYNEKFDEYDEPDECSGWKRYYRDGQIILPY